MSHSLTRLNLIQEAITLGDEDVIVLQSIRLPAEMKDLAELLTAKKYADAVLWIGEYRRDNFAPVEYRDPEIAGLQMELANLEAVLAELLAEKNEALHKIDAFTVEYNANLGEILEKIFELRLQMQEKRATADQNSKENEELKQARAEYEEFKQQQADTPQTVSLDAEQKKEIKNYSAKRRTFAIPTNCRMRKKRKVCECSRNWKRHIENKIFPVCVKFCENLKAVTGRRYRRRCLIRICCDNTSK